MKKLFTLIITFCIILSIVGCASDGKKTENNDAFNTENSNAVYAKDIKDGTYSISVDCNTSMFRVVNCELTVENGEMQAVMTMSGQGFGAVYMGTAEEALIDSEDKYIPALLNENGQKTFTVPVEALDKEIECAALSVKRNTWYDHLLIFKSDSIPKDALK